MFFTDLGHKLRLLFPSVLLLVSLLSCILVKMSFGFRTAMKPPGILLSIGFMGFKLISFYINTFINFKDSTGRSIDILLLFTINIINHLSHKAYNPNKHSFLLFYYLVVINHTHPTPTDTLIMTLVRSQKVLSRGMTKANEVLIISPLTPPPPGLFYIWLTRTSSRHCSKGSGWLLSHPVYLLVSPRTLFHLKNLTPEDPDQEGPAFWSAHYGGDWVIEHLCGLGQIFQCFCRKSFSWFLP